MRVLIVDDQKYNRELIAFMLTDAGHSYYEAGNGLEAVEAYQTRGDIDLILMDINMPVMDGYEATIKIKAQATDTHIPIFFITALDDEDTLSKCLEIGGDDFIPKPVNENVLVAKLRAHQRSLHLHKQLQASNQALQYHQRVMDREHRIVETVFRNGMQRMELGCDNISFHVSPMSMFNGDLLLIARSPLGGVYVLLGDFTGHGLSAAIGCLPVSDIFYAMAKKKASIGAIAREINAKLREILPANMFFCASILELDRAGDRMTLWSGGMNDLLLVDDAGVIQRRLQSQHMPLGVLSAVEFEDTADIVLPITGSRIYLYTDGIIEAQNRDGKMLGEAGLAEVLASTRGPSVQTISEAIEQYHQGTQQTDDISLVEIIGKPVTYKGLPAVYAAGPEGEGLGQPLPWKIGVTLTPQQLRNSNGIEQIVRLLSGVHEIASHQDIIFTIVSEIYNNSVEHGLLKLDSAIKAHDGGFERYYQLRAEKLAALEEGEISLQLSIENDGNSKLAITITDSGDGFDVADIASSQDDELAFARGLTLLGSLCSDFHYSNNGRTLTLRYPLQ